MPLEVFKIYQKKKIPIEDVLSKLVELGYARVNRIEEEGDFSIRGDILEIFPVSFDLPVRIEWLWDTIDKIVSFTPQTRTQIQRFDILILLPKFKRKYRHLEELPLNPMLSLAPGNLVVHYDYGIGIFRGTKQMTDTEGKKDFMEIEYRDHGRIYLPLEKSHLVQKYIHLAGPKPKLSTLGTKEWIKTRERTRKGIQSYALELVRIEALREVLGGFQFSENQWQDDFNKTFPYEETPDQEIAWLKTKELMESKKPMDMLVCGDVGYGKTEIAMRAAFKAVTNSKQVAFLVPTTILAEQHYRNFQNRTKSFPITIAMLSRFKTQSEQKIILQNISKGTIDIVIGTHRLISHDVVFKDLGLLIIDEEQRFGVLQKEKIKRLKTTVDVLSLSATPIPRTLYMSLTGIKEIAVIKTPPKQRLSVKTEVITFDLPTIKNIILDEKMRNGQVFFIDTTIQNLFHIKKSLDMILPKEIATAVAYGKMPTQLLENTILDFLDGKIDCLISTAIVESGMDIPKANTIIINNADHFGLSDLHQLRGRVGRFTRQAYAYLIIPKKNRLTQEAEQRIEAIRDYSYLGAGFDIAMQDLELRGAGTLLGTKQHGFIWAIGFDLYCRILRAEIENIKTIFALETKQ